MNVFLLLLNVNDFDQIACRKNGWPLDKSTLCSHVTTFINSDEIEKKPHTVSDGNIYITHR